MALMFHNPGFHPRVAAPFDAPVTTMCALPTSLPQDRRFWVEMSFGKHT